MTKQPDDLEMSEDLSPDVCPEGISQAMLASDYRESREEMEIETGITMADATLDEERESERMFGAIVGQLMTNFLKY